jgi:hypothetical protein
MTPPEAAKLSDRQLIVALREAKGDDIYILLMEALARLLDRPR